MFKDDVSFFFYFIMAIYLDILQNTVSVYHQRSIGMQMYLFYFVSQLLNK
jgi:hypothetical protein